MTDLEKTKAFFDSLGISCSVISTSDHIALDINGGAKFEDAHGCLATTFFFSPSGNFRLARMYEV